MWFSYVLVFLFVDFVCLLWIHNCCTVQMIVSEDIGRQILTYGKRYVTSIWTLFSLSLCIHEQTFSLYIFASFCFQDIRSMYLSKKGYKKHVKY